MKTEKQQKLLVYECLGYQSKGKHVCRSFTIPARTLDDFANKSIAGAIKRLQTSQKTTGRLKEKLEELDGDDVAARIEALKRELAQKKIELENLGKALRRAPDSSKILSELSKAEAEVKRFAADLSAAQGTTRTRIDVAAAAAEMMGYLGEATMLFRHGTIQERKAVVGSFLGKVVIRPDHREARFQFFKMPRLPVKKSASPVGAGAFHKERCGGWI